MTRADCADAVAGHAYLSPTDIFRAAGVFGDAHDDRDLYGTGKRLEAFEARVAALLGKEAAVFMPSGTMAQQIVLRIAADRSGIRTFGAHATNHVTLHEQGGFARLHDLQFVPLGSAVAPLSLEDVRGVAEPLSTLLIELPQREIGGVLPAWDELLGWTSLARERGWSVHLDGARLWESGPFYARPYAEIAALFDTVYVSFYKGIGALAGAMLCGSAVRIAEARVWQRRHGGNLFTLFPYACTAEAAFDQRIGRMPDYRHAATWLAGIVAEQPATVRVQPSPPHTNMFHAYLRLEAPVLAERATAIARDLGVWTVNRSAATAIDGIVKWEISAGDATLALGPERARSALAALLAA